MDGKDRAVQIAVLLQPSLAFTDADISHLSASLVAHFQASIPFYTTGSLSVPVSLQQIISALYCSVKGSVSSFHSTPSFVFNRLDDSPPVNESHYSLLSLPHISLVNAIDALVYNDDLKDQLMAYAQTSLSYGYHQINPHIISSTRTLLLYGPPGTGKTSLCRALAQQLSIRLFPKYPSGVSLVEVHAHALFSRWFSESGKLVQKLFNRIFELCEDVEALVFVVIDEVESLAAARSQAVANGEPSDAIRAVNALLTQIDELGRRPNVMVMSTSNMAKAMDAAFVDRADWKVFIGPPDVAARRVILQSCVDEMIRVGIVSNDEAVDSDALDAAVEHAVSNSAGLSGRLLRKMVVVAHAVVLRGREQLNAIDLWRAIGEACKNESVVRQSFMCE